MRSQARGSGPHLSRLMMTASPCRRLASSSDRPVLPEEVSSAQGKVATPTLLLLASLAAPLLASLACHAVQLACHGCCPQAPHPTYPSLGGQPAEPKPRASSLRTGRTAYRRAGQLSPQGRFIALFLTCDELSSCQSVVVMSDNEKNVAGVAREQDRFLPIANIACMGARCPPHLDVPPTWRSSVDLWVCCW